MSCFTWTKGFPAAKPMYRKNASKCSGPNSIVSANSFALTNRGEFASYFNFFVHMYSRNWYLSTVNKDKEMVFIVTKMATPPTNWNKRQFITTYSD